MWTGHVPARGRSVMLTSPYSVEIRNDSIISHLPYYGRAYSIPYGGGEGLNFKAPLTDYKLDWDKKGTAKIKFTARSTEDKFDFDIDIFSNGSSTIFVNMQKPPVHQLSGRSRYDGKRNGKIRYITCQWLPLCNDILNLCTKNTHHAVCSPPILTNIGNLKAILNMECASTYFPTDARIFIFTLGVGLHRR